MGPGFEPKQGLKEPINQVTAHVAEGSRERLSAAVKEKHSSSHICGRDTFRWDSPLSFWLANKTRKFTIPEEIVVMNAPNIPIFSTCTACGHNSNVKKKKKVFYFLFHKSSCSAYTGS